MNAQRAHEDRLQLAGERREERRAAKVEQRRKRAARRSRERRPGLTPISEDAVTPRDRWMRIPWLAACEGCCVQPATERHHAIREQTLKANAHSHGYDLETVRWDVRLRILLCSDCHESHTNRSRRLPASILCQETIDCALELGLLWALEGEYRQEDETA